jgi:DNA-binding transcriptional ArsR family regulator
MNTNSVDTNLMKALAHPLRQRILIELNKRVASPSELAEEIGEPLGNVSYHVRMLVDLQCIELVSTTPRRGALEHHYRATVPPLFDDDTWKLLPTATRRKVMGDVLKEIFTAVGSAADGGSFDEDSVHVTRDLFELDDQGWQDITELLRETHERAAEIGAQSAARAKKAGSETRPTNLAMMHFGSAQADAPAPKRRKKSTAKR